MSTGYCAVEDVQAELKNTDAAIVPQIEAAILAAAQYIDGYKLRDYRLHDFTTSPLVIRWSSKAIIRATLFLPYSPVISIVSVTAVGEEWVLDQDYYVNGTRQLVALGRDWPLLTSEADSKIEIRGTFGYQENEAPPNIKSACALIAAAFTGHNTKDIITVDGQRSQIVTREIPKAALEMLGARGAAVWF